MLARTQAGQGQGWIRSAGNDEVQPGRKMLDEKHQRVMGVLVSNQVIIVQDEQHIFLQQQQGIQQRGDNRFYWWRWTILPPLQCFLPKAWQGVLKRRTQIPPKAQRVVLARFQ